MEPPIFGFCFWVVPVGVIQLKQPMPPRTGTSSLRYLLHLSFLVFAIFFTKPHTYSSITLFIFAFIFFIFYSFNGLVLVYIFENSFFSNLFSDFNNVTNLLFMIINIIYFINLWTTKI